MKTVSVLIPTFNRANYIADAVNSILLQTVSPYQIIVIDDGSTDATSDVLSQFGDKILYIRKKNEGKSSAINLALNDIKGNYVWLFDDDDIACPDAIRVLLEPHLQEPTIDYSFGQFTPAYIDDNTKEIVPIAEPIPKKFDICMHLYTLLEYNYFSLSTALIKTSWFNKIGLFDTRLIRSQDYDFLIRLSRSAQVRFVKENIFWYRQHEGVRGSVNQRINREQKNDAWRHYDQIIGEKIQTYFSPEVFLHPSLLDCDPRIQKRAILLQQANIFASKNLPEIALEKFVQACDMFLNNIVPITYPELDSLNSYLSWPCVKMMFIENSNFRTKFLLSIQKSHNRILSRKIAKRIYWSFRIKLQQRDYLQAAKLGLLSMRAGLL